MKNEPKHGGGNEYTFHIYISGDVNMGHFLPQCEVGYQNNRFRCLHGGEVYSSVGITGM